MSGKDQANWGADFIVVATEVYMRFDDIPLVDQMGNLCDDSIDLGNNSFRITRTTSR